MPNVVSANPFRCRMWSLHDRLDSYVTEESCRNEIESFAKHGQIMQVVGRNLKDDPHHEIELIYGARRLFVARHLNRPLLVELRDISDRDALLLMDIENRHRRDITAYERGLSYARWLRSKHFSSQEEIAKALRLSPSRVSRLLQLARLPSVIVNAFASPADICEGWGLDIMRALDDPQRRDATLLAARALGRSGPRPAALEVYRTLMSASTGARKVPRTARDEVVKDENGASVFRIRRLRKVLAVMLPVHAVPPAAVDEIRTAILKILHSATAQAADPASGRPSALLEHRTRTRDTKASVAS